MVIEEPFAECSISVPGSRLFLRETDAVAAAGGSSRTARIFAT